MNTTYKVTVGDRGRLVIPSELRATGKFDPGTDLTLIAGDEGLVLLNREQLLARVRENLSTTGDLVAELLAERREAARSESSSDNPDEADFAA